MKDLVKFFSIMCFQAFVLLCVSSLEPFVAIIVFLGVQAMVAMMVMCNGEAVKKISKNGE